VYVAQPNSAECTQRHNRMVPRLVDVMSALATADPEATIYVATPAGPQSKAIVRVEPEEGRDQAGLTYLLEVSLARDVLQVWTSWRNGRQPNGVALSMCRCTIV